MLFNLVTGTVQLFHLLYSSHIPEKLLDFFQMIFVRKIVELPSKFSQKLNMKAITGKVLSDKDFAITLQKKPHKFPAEFENFHTHTHIHLQRFWAASKLPAAISCKGRTSSGPHSSILVCIKHHTSTKGDLCSSPHFKEHFPSFAQPPDKAAECVTSKYTRWDITESVAGRRGRRDRDEEHRRKTASHWSPPKPLLSRLKAAVLQWEEPFGGNVGWLQEKDSSLLLELVIPPTALSLPSMFRTPKIQEENL